MADEKVISHKAFGKVCDSAYVDTEDLSQVPISTLDECRNLTSFNKLGSLKQMAGFSTVKANADLPNETDYALTGYQPVDMYIFGLDKDQKEIYLLVYKNSSNLTRFFITPFYNPPAHFSNYNPLYTAESWVTSAWLELTEKYTVDVQVTGANTVTFTSGTNPIANATNKLTNFFIVNTEQSASFVDRASKYNYITNHSYSAGTHTLTLKGDITGWGAENWTNNDTCVIVRFPVTYFYKAQPNSLANVNGSFDGLPTDYIYRDGQLRIPCGKNNKPLILDFIQNRKYFLGNSNSMSYEGFWFDFQSLPQKQKHSAVTAWQSRATSASGTPYDITVNMSNQVYWDTAGFGKVTINPVSGNFRIKISSVAIATYNIWKNAGWLVELIPGKLAVFQNWQVVIVDNVTITQTQFVASYNTAVNPLYGMSYATASAGDVTDFVNVGNIPFPYTNQVKNFAGTSGFFGYEAGKNSLAFNPFVGVSLLMEECQAIPTSVQRNVLIVNLIYDNRSQILLGHGTYDTTNGFEIHFNLWFNRRLTGISLFNESSGASGAGNVDSYVIETEIYPYYKWRKDFGTSGKSIRINELKHFTQYNLYDFTKGVNGQLAEFISNVSDNTTGQNGYTYTNKTLTYYRGNGSNTLYNHCWFIQFNNTNQSIATDGKGMKYVAKCNRYIDQDTTMNYERVAFVGQTNGRFFPIGIKNIIEEEPFESNDLVCYNIYAGAVSEYDTFLRDRFMPVSFGDKDQLRAIENYDGYLFLAKDNNSFALEVNTDNEIKYRTIDTRLGRGISDPKLLLQTPYGLIMPTSDGVWLVTKDGTERILTPDNGKLELYKTLFSSNIFKSVIYDKKFNELYLAFQSVDDAVPATYTTYIFIYSFEEQKWGGYYYFTFNNGTGTRPSIFREDTNRNIVFLNYDYSTSSLANCRIDKFDNTSSVFIQPNGTTFPIVWLMKTHYTPYGGRMQDVILQKFSLLYDTSAITSKQLTLKIYKDNLSATSYTLNLNDTASSIKNQIQEIVGKFEGVASTLAFSLENNASNGFSNFTINGVDLWLAYQQRRKIN